jgi:hypothetical protein
MIGDPAMDVAFTGCLYTVPARVLIPDLDPEQLEETYLDAYRRARPLDETNIVYYGAIRCVQALLEGAQGQAVWRHPDVLKLLLASIYDVAGIKIETPF